MAHFIVLKGCNRASLWRRSPCLSGFSAIHGITRVPEAQFLNMLKPAHWFSVIFLLAHYGHFNTDLSKWHNIKNGILIFLFSLGNPLSTTRAGTWVANSHWMRRRFFSQRKLRLQDRCEISQLLVLIPCSAKFASV